MAPCPAMGRGALPAALLLALLAAPLPAAGRAPEVGRGERVDIASAEFPPLAVAGRAFFVNVTLENREDAERSVLVFTTLYRGSSETPCEGARAIDFPSAFNLNALLGPLERVRIVGEERHWRHVINGSRLEGDGAYEVCVWVRLTECPRTPEGAPDVARCLLDFEPSLLRIRARNMPPSVALRAEPAPAAAEAAVSFQADARDPEGDPLSFAWDFGDGDRREGGASANHRYARPGRYTARVNVSDGFDTALAEATVEVLPAGSVDGGPVPGPAPPVLAGALLAAALLRRAAAGRASRGGR